MMALAILRRWPKQIEADLHRFYHLDVLDWHRGTLTSRKLLVLLEELPDTSRFKREAERHGDWSVFERMVQTIANELSQLRASYHAVARSDEYAPEVWFSPAQLREQREDEEDSQELQGELFGSLFVPLADSEGIL